MREYEYNVAKFDDDRSKERKIGLNVDDQTKKVKSCPDLGLLHEGEALNVAKPY